VYFALDDPAKHDSDLRQRILVEVKIARDRGLIADADYFNRSFKSQLDQAHKLGARLVVIVWGPGAGGVTIRRNRGDEWPVPIEGLADALVHELA
jgi:histidyl-tRNA synthetase